MVSLLPVARCVFVVGSGKGALLVHFVFKTTDSSLSTFSPATVLALLNTGTAMVAVFTSSTTETSSACCTVRLSWSPRTQPSLLRVVLIARLGSIEVGTACCRRRRRQTDKSTTTQHSAVTVGRPRHQQNTRTTVEED